MFCAKNSINRLLIYEYFLLTSKKNSSCSCHLVLLAHTFSPTTSYNQMDLLSLEIRQISCQFYFLHSDGSLVSLNQVDILSLEIRQISCQFYFLQSDGSLVPLNQIDLLLVLLPTIRWIYCPFKSGRSLVSFTSYNQMDLLSL